MKNGKARSILLFFVFITAVVLLITSPGYTAEKGTEGMNDLELEQYHKMMYEKLADVVAEIANQPEHIGSSGYSNIGMVIGGTSPESTTALRKKFDKMWFLVPGFGSQGATAADCLRFCKPDGTGALINASRSIIYAYEKPKYKDEFGDNWEKCIEQAVIDAKVELAKAM